MLHTHHHRDQCWGDARLIEAGARLAVPQYERHLFEKAELFWQTRRVYDNYDDRNNFLTVSRDLPVSATLNDYEEFAWRSYRFYVLPAKGHTQGSVVLLAEIDGRLVVFSGDLMVEGGKLYQLHAMEYTYGDMTGALFTLQSIQALRDALSGGGGGRAFPRRLGRLPWDYLPTGGRSKTPWATSTGWRSPWFNWSRWAGECGSAGGRAFPRCSTCPSPGSWSYPSISSGGAPGPVPSST